MKKEYKSLEEIWETAREIAEIQYPEPGEFQEQCYRETSAQLELEYENQLSNQGWFFYYQKLKGGNNVQSKFITTRDFEIRTQSKV